MIETLYRFMSLRTRLNYSVREMAKHTGLSTATVSRIENGANIDLDTARMIGPFIDLCPCCEQKWPETVDNGGNSDG
ncbi:putative transcriptional regulator [Phyllobacterium sp. YR531]|nr:putative transcriptional regulator [Phyllobacterium sp. YR531]